jgi:UDP-N-acetylmuramate dehydrogenase
LNAAADTLNRSSTLVRGEPMAKHTSWRVGGAAELFYRPSTRKELATFLAGLASETPVLWVGLGSNLLVRDGGIRGVVISTGALPKVLERLDATRVRAGAGVSCARLARRCVQWQLGPAAFFAGIPGSIGGALAMNAGAFGGETWTSVEAVETVDRRGIFHVRPREDFSIAYRRAEGVAGEWFVAATFRFEHDDTADPATIRTLLARRSASQPLGVPSCGSVFRNPPGDHAGRLVEAAGLKGYRIGGAAVSDKHANFIINDGSASAADIEALIEHVRREVARLTGVELETEVRIVGDPLGADADA